MGERTHNHLCEDLAKLSGTFERGGANLKGERAFRPTHASATCAYPRDALSELSLPRPLAQVMGRLGKDVRAMFELFSSSALRLALAGPVRACARSRTALPACCAWVPASQPGSDDLPERREQQRAQVCPPTIACPCPRPCVQFDVRSTHHLCGGCAQAGCNSEAPNGAIISTASTAIAMAPPHVRVAMLMWLCVGPAIPRGVLCERSWTSLGGRVTVLSCLWAFGAAVGVHIDHMHPSVTNARV